MKKVWRSVDASDDLCVPVAQPDGARSALCLAIDRWAAILLDEQAGPDALRVAVNAAHAGLLESSGMPDTVETRLVQGRALSGLDAANCLLDFQRTARFLRAVDSALHAAVARWPGQIIRVLYACCGPWAPMLLLLAPRW